jgi:serine/threonine protein kinase
VKVGDFGLSKRIEETLGLSSTLQGTPRYIAPELYNFHEPGIVEVRNTYAGDMWSLGEIAFRMLTKTPSFPNLGLLFGYARNLQEFPIPVLKENNVSTAGQNFILSLMQSSPEKRLPAAEALRHEWMQQQMSRYSRADPATYDR